MQSQTRISPFWSSLLLISVYLAIKFSPEFDKTYSLPREHFIIVSTASIISAIVAIGIGISGTRLRNLQVIFVSLGFTSLAIIFSVHGLTTPGFLLAPNRIVGIAVQLSLLLISFWLWLSSFASDHPITTFLDRNQRILLPGWTMLLVAFSIIAITNPEIATFLPIDEAPLQWFAAITTLLLASAASYRYWQAHRYAHFPLQSIISHAAGMIAVAQIITSTAEIWKLSWWMYHILLIAAMLLAVVALYQQYYQGQSLALAVRSLFSNDPIERLEAGISPSVRQLIAQSEAQDKYTAGHSRRVALDALRLGNKLGLNPEELRALAQGSILHDIGKLEVPVDLLNKKDILTSEEREIVNKHPRAGHEICKRLGFMQEELNIILAHHERYDGDGYPNGITGEKIPNLARILTVVDVYDALTSDRAYRGALTKKEAIAILQAERGKQFDANIVNLWVEMIS